jgi:hypothetical protein
LTIDHCFFAILGGQLSKPANNGRRSMVKKPANNGQWSAVNGQHSATMVGGQSSMAISPLLVTKYWQ